MKRRAIDRVIEAQTQMMQGHLQRMDDPAIFDRYQQQFEENPIIRQQIERFGPPVFFEQMGEMEQRMQGIQRQQQELKWQKMQEINQQMFQAPPGQPPPPEMMKRIYTSTTRDASTRDASASTTRYASAARDASTG